MNPNAKLLEQLQVVSGFVPLALTTARTGDVVSMKGYRRCLVLFFKAAGTANDDPTITLLQGTSVAFGTSKPLDFTEIYKKQGADLTAIGKWVKVVQAAANTYTDTDSAEAQAIWAIEVKAEDLDIANDFDCLRASISDVGTNAQLGCLLYLMGDPVQLNSPEDMASAIAD